MKTRATRSGRVKWASVPGYSLQEVSTTGQLRYTYSHVPCRLTPIGSGRKRVRLIPDDGGSPVSMLVARVVLLTFVGPHPDPEKKNACHRNDVCSDDRLENLYWGSHKDNRLDALRNRRAIRLRVGRSDPGPVLAAPPAPKAPSQTEMKPELSECVDAVVAAASRLREFLGGKGRMSVFIETHAGKWNLLIDRPLVAPAAAPARTPQGAAAC
jgi:hypothetical protein